MPSRKSKPPKAHGVSHYINAVYFRQNRLWKMVGSRLLTQVNGEWMDSKEFDERYPIPVKLSFYHNPENSDKTKTWML